VCKPICADLPTAPITKKTPIKVIGLKTLPKIKILCSIKIGNKAKTVLKFKVLVKIKTKIIPNKKLKSPTLFITKAFIALLFACILVYQKFINK
jgi:hypothetical protein